MSHTRLVLLSVATAALATTLFSAGHSTAPALPALPLQAAKAQMHPGQMPLIFEPNVGQTASNVQFLSRASGYTLYLTRDEAVMELRRGKTEKPSVVRMHLDEANRTPAVEGVERLPGQSNYFVGQDRSQWHTNVPQYARVRYRGVYPGIDAVYYGNERRLEYDFVVAPGADPNRIQLSYNGVDRLSVNRDGDLVLAVAGRELVQQRPIAYQELGGRRVNVASHYRLDHQRVQIAVAGYDRTQPLVIDPTVVYSTFLGGTGTDAINSIVVDGSGNTYFAGTTTSTNFPVTSGAFQSNAPSPISSAFIGKLNATGTALLYSTYIGGSGSASAVGLAVDNQGNAYVTGNATGTFPTTLGAYNSIGVGGGLYVAKLSASGSSLLYTTGYDGNGAASTAIGIDASGNAYVTGYTSFTIPVVPQGGVPQWLNKGYVDAFVAAFNTTGSNLIYSTYLGGVGYDYARAIAVDAAGNATIVGDSDSYNFPKTTGVAQPNSHGAEEAFVTRLNPSGSAFTFSTMLGGSGNDSASGVALDSAGNAYVVGSTNSSDFPTTTGVVQTTPGSTFVTKVSADGSSFPLSTYLNPTTAYDYSNLKRVVALDASGNIFVAGSTTIYSGLPGLAVTGNALQSSPSGGSDGFLFELNPTATSILYGTYLGGASDDYPYALAVDSTGAAYLAGYTASSNFLSTSGVVQPHLSGGGDGFVVKISMAAATCTYSMSSPSQAFGGSGGSGSFSLTAGSACPWSASAADNWVTISSGASGNGSGTVNYTVAPNTSTSSRSTTISVAGQTFSITQAGAACTYSLSAASGQFTGGGGSALINITAPGGCSWTATSDSAWATIYLGASGNGAGVVQYTVAQNPTPSARTATLTIGGQTVTISEAAGCSYSLGAATASFGSNGGTGSVTVANGSNCGWSASSDSIWTVITSGGGGTGNGTVLYTVSANTTQSVRTATLTIAGLTYTVSQAGLSCSFTLSSNSTSVAAAGGSGSLTINGPSSCAWNATSDSAWATVTSSGTGTGSAAFSIAANTGTQSRTATLTVGGQSFTIAQAGVVCTYTLSVSSASFSAAGGSGSVSLTAPTPCSWTASSDSAWSTVTASGSGSAQVSFNVAANSATSPRTATLTIGGQTFTIAEAALVPVNCTYSLSSSSATYTSSGGSNSVTVSAPTGCSWIAASDSTWLTIGSTPSGSGTGSVQYTVAPNGSQQSRAGNLTIGGQSLAVSEAGAIVSGALPVSKIGIFRPSGSGGALWVRDRNGDGLFTGAPDTAVGVGVFGTTGDIPILGDWSGTGTKKLGFYRPASSTTPGQGLLLLDVNGDEQYTSGVDKAHWFPPLAGDVPVVGRWNGGAKDQIGIFRQGVWYLDINGDGSFAKTIVLGQNGDVPVVGDWNGTGTTKVGVFRNGLWILDYNGNGQWDGPSIDRFFYLGQAGDTPIVGDWSGSGSTKAGIFRAGLWVLDYNGNGQWDGIGVDKALFNGVAGDLPAIGDWTGDGRAKAGVFHNGTWFLDVNGDSSFSRLAFIGQSGDLPITGVW